MGPVALSSAQGCICHVRPLHVTSGARWERRLSCAMLQVELIACKAVASHTLHRNRLACARDPFCTPVLELRTMLLGLPFRLVHM